MPSVVNEGDDKTRADTLSALFQRTVEAHKASRLDEAENGYRAILQNAPHEAHVHYLLGTVLMAKDKPLQAIESLEQCTKLDGSHADAFNTLGSLFSGDGRHEKAIQALKTATDISPENETIWFNLGNALVDNQLFHEATTAFKRAIKIRSDYWKAINGLGLCLGELGEIQEAIDCLTQCVEQEPTILNAHENLIRYLVTSKQYSEVLERCHTAIERFPKAVRFYVFESVAHQHFEEEESAYGALEKAIELEPDNTFALNQMSNYLYAQGQWKDAESYCLKSLQLEPESSKTINNLGRIRLMRGDIDGARSLYVKALQIDPDFADAHNNLGNLLLYVDEFDEALRSFDIAIKLKPDKAGYRFNRTAVFMSMGDPAPIWRDYRLRFEKSENKVESEDWPWPMWDGESLDGKKILLWTEQGIGDEVLTCRYVSSFIEEADKVVLVCNQRLESLFSRSIPELVIATRDHALDEINGPGPFDFHSPIIDLVNTRIQPAKNIPAAPLLKPDPQLSGSLRKTYKEQSEGRPLVGIAWRSGGTHFSHFKSTDLKDWSTILTNRDVTFVNLQYGDVHEEIAEVEKTFGIKIVTDTNINPFGDIDPLAAQIAAMDLVITTSNTTAHIAGALGKPVWNMTPTGPGRLWYWFSEGTETPWYPGMKLFRHRHNEGWERVLADVGKQLSSIAPQLGNQTLGHSRTE